MALRQIVSGGDAERRHLLFADIIVDGVQFEGRERTKNDVDLVVLDELLRLDLRAGRIAAGIGGKQLHFSAAHGGVVVLQERQHALFHLDAALRQRASLDREESDLDRWRLRDRRCREAPECGGRTGGSGAPDQRSAAEFAGHRLFLL